MSRLPPRLAAVPAGLCLAPSAAWADAKVTPTDTVPNVSTAAAKVALVIGNSAYATVGVLPNPSRDAKAMGQILWRAGFTVITALNLSQDDMRGVIRDFAARVTPKGPD